MSDYLPKVRAQYEEFPYPPVDPQDEYKRLILTLTESFPYLSQYCFSGLRDPRKGMRFLVAGGGTGHAAIALAEQLRESTDCELHYVDISTASRAIAKERARIRGLKERIHWHHGSLLEVGKMGLGTFDYINCSGVLHHLADPQAGLDALVSVLKPDGALGLMVYAEYGRMSVYQMQALMRIANTGVQDQQQQVENAKRLFESLPPENWLHFSPKIILNELRGGDAAIYDLILHSQDRAYTIPQLYDWIGASGLKLVELFPDDHSLGKMQYDPAYYVNDDKLLARIKALPLREQQAIAELMNGKICKHTFYAARNVPPQPTLSDPEMVPFFTPSFPTVVYENLRRVVGQSKNIITLKEGNTTVVFKMTPNLPAIVGALDGKRSMRELHAAVPGMTYDDFVKEFASMYDVLHQYDWMFLRHKSIPPYVTLAEMENRVKAHA